MDLHNLFLVAVGGSIVVAIVSGDRDGLEAAQGRGDAPRAYVSVEYADTFQGIQSLYAVRACSTEDRAASPTASVVAIGREQLTDTKDDVVVRVIDRDGKEISRHVGPADVCGYARIAAAFVTSINTPSPGDTK